MRLDAARPPEYTCMHASRNTLEGFAAGSSDSELRGVPDRVASRQLERGEGAALVRRVGREGRVHLQDR